MDAELASNDYFIGEFGDKRLLKKGIEIFKKMCEKLTINIRKLASDRSTEVSIHRFLDNENVTQEEIEKNIAEKTIKNIGDLNEILIINDTSEVSYSSQKQKKAFFGSTGNKYGNGFFIHPNIVVNPVNKAVLGLAGVEIWQREDESAKKSRSKKGIEEKESYKWIKAMSKAQTYLRHVAQKIFITDRESDIYEYMSLIIKSGDAFIVRSIHNRKIEEDELYVEERIHKTEVSYCYESLIEETPKRKKRIAKLHLRYGELTLLQPKSVKGDSQYPEKIKVSFVDAEEDGSTAPNEESKIHWRLLTNKEVSSAANAIGVVEKYMLRWTIEPIFAGSKKRGLDLEACQISSFEKLKKLATIALSSLVHVFYLIKARDGKNDLSANMIFSDEQIVFLNALLKTLEGKTQKQKNPFLSGSLSWASWIIARLGGWKGYTSERPPGHGTMHDGLQKFYNMFQGWKICHI
jgi:hypothetical protein